MCAFSVPAPCSARHLRVCVLLPPQCVRVFSCTLQHNFLLSCGVRGASCPPCSVHRAQFRYAVMQHTHLVQSPATMHPLLHAACVRLLAHLALPSERRFLPRCSVDMTVAHAQSASVADMSTPAKVGFSCPCAFSPALFCAASVIPCQHAALALSTISCNDAVCMRRLLAHLAVCSELHFLRAYC